MVGHVNLHHPCRQRAYLNRHFAIKHRENKLCIYCKMELRQQLYEFYKFPIFYISLCLLFYIIKWYNLEFRSKVPVLWFCAPLRSFAKYNNNFYYAVLNGEKMMPIQAFFLLEINCFDTVLLRFTKEYCYDIFTKCKIISLLLRTNERTIWECCLFFVANSGIEETISVVAITTTIRVYLY